MYALCKTRPNTGKVCRDDQQIGLVTSQRRQRGLRFFTATPTLPDGRTISGSIGTRYPTAMAAARALWLFDRDYAGITRSHDRGAIHSAIEDYRTRYGVTPGRKFVSHVPA